jgi:hypothetical protein
MAFQQKIDYTGAMGRLGATWGIGGFLLLICYAAFWLTLPAAEALSMKLSWCHWALLIANTTLVLWAKGYHGFQKGLSKRVVSRARALADSPTATKVILAPLYCMGYFGSGRRRQQIMIILTAAMVGLVFLVRLLSQPWRGLIDFGIVAALAWGIVATVVRSIRAGPFPVS